ncbi:hypothetical protein [Chitinophaga arvensicola]|uniref:Uncharacterized protein n=1 Tax=Chitinophaga arvensicola TaxID=29529 RepID=A0A1I0QEQ5_9BACT|nr:hypothetical protein [Chitinophaga arvensicola]SEW25443.1 hypothetical protein SAMN04488122_1414 [Chitinophaga arvensicola]
MSQKKSKIQKSKDELEASFVFPVKLSQQHKKEAALLLAEARKKRRQEASDKDKLISGLLSLRFQLEDYINGNTFNPDLSFGYFLSEYVSLLEKKRKVFAEEISIDETLLSQLINLKRDPPDYVTVRLELHSNRAIPADYWYRLVEKRREHFIRTDKSIRKKEKQFVQNKLNVHIS